MGGRWVYAIKHNADEAETYKARYVTKGYSQVIGGDYKETFSPTANITSIRALMQMAAQYDLVLHQMDVKTAYLHAPIDCEIYTEQPEGFEVKSDMVETLVCKLNKSLYKKSQAEIGIKCCMIGSVTMVLYRIQLTIEYTVNKLKKGE